MSGIVTRVNVDKGYALAEGADGYTYFLFALYFDSLSYHRFEDLQEGATVKFEPTWGPKGKRGVDVEIIVSRGLDGL